MGGELKRKKSEWGRFNLFARQSVKKREAHDLELTTDYFSAFFIEAPHKVFERLSYLAYDAPCPWNPRRSVMFK
jgi:hypothetical protein